MLSQHMIMKYLFFGCVWRQFIEIIELSWNYLISVDDRKTHFIKSAFSQRVLLFVLLNEFSPIYDFNIVFWGQSLSN